MEGLLNLMRQEAARADAQVARDRFGTVTSYDPDAYAVKVMLQPEGYETGWAKLATPEAGNGFGTFLPPEPGDQVWVGFENGDVASPVVLGAFYSDEDRPVVEGIGSCPAGEKWFVHRSGSRLRFLGDGTVEVRGKTEEQMVKLHPDGTVEVQAKAGTRAKLNADGSVDINAPVLCVGAVGAVFRKLVNDTFLLLFNTHTHANGPPPNQQMTPAHLTENLTAS